MRKVVGNYNQGSRKSFVAIVIGVSTGLNLKRRKILKINGLHAKKTNCVLGHKLFYVKMFLALWLNQVDIHKELFIRSNFNDSRDGLKNRHGISTELTL